MAGIKVAIAVFLAVCAATCVQAQTAEGACSDILNRCRRGLRCNAVLQCYESCSQVPNPTGLKPLDCIVGCNARAITTAPLYLAYISCMRVNNKTVAIADAQTFIAASPETVFNLLSQFGPYKQWTGGDLVFIPPPRREGNGFILLTKPWSALPVGAPVPCKLTKMEFDRFTNTGKIAFGGSFIPLSGNSVFGYDHSFSVVPMTRDVNGVPMEGTLLTNHEVFQGAVIPLAPFVWSGLANQYQKFNGNAAVKLAAPYEHLSVSCEGQCKDL